MSKNRSKPDKKERSSTKRGIAERGFMPIRCKRCNNWRPSSSFCRKCASAIKRPK